MAKLSNIVGQHGQNANVAQMLPSLTTVSADKFIRKFVAEMFLHAHFLATFVVQFDVSQFGHNVGQQFNSIFQMAKVNMRSVEVRTVQSGNKMAAAPHVDLDGVDVEADSPPEGEDHGKEDGDDDRGAIILKELVRKYRKNKKSAKIHALVLLPVFQFIFI